MTDCMIEICNTHTITFGYQDFSHKLPSTYIWQEMSFIDYCEYKDQD